MAAMTGAAARAARRNVGNVAKGREARVAAASYSKLTCIKRHAATKNNAVPIARTERERANVQSLANNAKAGVQKRYEAWGIKINTPNN